MNRGAPRKSSNYRICWLIAESDTESSEAAALKDPSLPAASNAFKWLSGGRRRIFRHKIYLTPPYNKLLCQNSPTTLS